MRMLRSFTEETENKSATEAVELGPFPAGRQVSKCYHRLLFRANFDQTCSV